MRNKQTKKTIKINFFFLFFDNKHKEENPTALQKANMEEEKYVWGINCMIYKKKEKNINFFFNKENFTAPQKAIVMVETCWGISTVIYKKKKS